jgi:CRISPR-associated exonuclease Cas4
MDAMNVEMMAATLIVLALALFWWSARLRRRTGIPAGEVFYQDLAGQPFTGDTLRSFRLGVSGKPDCLIRTSEGVVPVELKLSSRPPARGEVYPNHMIQNLAYCALVEEQMHVRVPYGLVIYASQQVRRVEFNDASRKWLLQVIAEVQRARNDGVGIRNHNHKGRCIGCGVRSHCDQALF